MDLFDRAGLSLRFDEVAYMEWLEYKDHNASCEVLQRTAQRHADRQTGRCEDRDERRGVDTEDADDRDNQKQRQRDAHQAHQETFERSVYLSFGQHFAQDVFQVADDPAADRQDDQGDQDTGRDVEGAPDDHANDFFSRHVGQGDQFFRDFFFVRRVGHDRLRRHP